jgi:Flp pilus assembly protein TadG
MVLRSSTACPNIVTRLARDASGTVLIYVALLMPVIIGMSALAIDAGRLNNLHTSLQNAADALALAGAAELDRRPTAITRANAAIDNLTANRDKFATTAPATVAIESRRYLKSLPTSDATAIGSGNVAANAAEARFVEVTVAPKSFRNLFPVSLFNPTPRRRRLARSPASMLRCARPCRCSSVTLSRAAAPRSSMR